MTRPIMETENARRLGQLKKFKWLLEQDLTAGIKARPEWMPDHIFNKWVVTAAKLQGLLPQDEEQTKVEWPLDAPQPTERELLEEEFRQNLRKCGPYDAAPVPVGLPDDIARGIALDEAWRQKTARSDNVNSPSHYTTGGIECFDAMRAMLTEEEFIGYLRGNSFKYRWRFRHKNGAEDLKKAEWYERKLLEIIDVSA